MRFITKFRIGEKVRRQTGKGAADPTFTIGQIRIETIKSGGSIIQYRANYSTGRNGPWYAEEFLREGN